ncbi:MAG: SMC-Scp complex subunit ScpB [Actinomycetota bacterium]
MTIDPQETVDQVDAELVGEIDDRADSPVESPASKPLDASTVRALEAIVLVASDPVSPELLAEILEIPSDSVVAICESLATAYEEAGHGFQLIKVAGGYRYQSHPDAAAYVERFILDGQRARLSGAALETLAIVAYKQPISRAQIASIRGVDPDAVLRTLQSRGYIDQAGRDPGPGQAVLWATTPLLLEKLGIDSINDLPAIAEFMPEADVVEALESGLRVSPIVADEPSGSADPSST